MSCQKISGVALQVKKFGPPFYCSFSRCERWKSMVQMFCTDSCAKDKGTPTDRCPCMSQWFRPDCQSFKRKVFLKMQKLATQHEDNRFKNNVFASCAWAVASINDLRSQSRGALAMATGERRELQEKDQSETSSGGPAEWAVRIGGVAHSAISEMILSITTFA